MSTVVTKASSDMQWAGAPTRPPVPARADLYRALQRNRFLGLLRDDTLLEVAALAQCRAYGQGELITASGTACNSFFAILRGSMRFYLLSGDGRKVTLNSMHAGDVFWYGPPDLFAFSRQPEGATHCAEAQV